MMKKLLLACFICLSTLYIFAQDPLAENFKLYQKTSSTGLMFVHFDKNVYSNNEMVWFTGYLINSRDMSKHHLMSVSVIRESDNKVVLEDRFVMKNGFSFGSFNLPDSIAAGNYRLLAITDYTINNLPEASFTQPITIKSVLEPPFKASMKIMASNNKENKVMVSATTADNRFLAKPAEVTYTYGNIKKTIQTDASGQAVITLPQLDNLTDGNLYVKLHYDKDSTSINMPIIQPKGSPSIKFYPEGGNLISGLINNIGWEVRDRQTKPIATKAYLYKNDKAIDTINADAYGLGAFKLFVEDDAKYTLKVTGNNLKDTLFTLPNALKDGIALHVIDAVVTDTIKINIRAKQTQQVGIRVHNFRESYLYTKFEIQPGARTLKIPLTQVPKGLASITITNTEEQPLAERIFFAHYDNSEKVAITSDKTSYDTREKVNLKLKLKNINETAAVVSIAVVQDNRMEPGKITDIENFTYLNNELASMPINTKGSTFKNKKYLEQLLLIKGWRKYNWQDLNKVKAADTNSKFVNLLYTGTVTKNKKPLTKAVDVGAMSGEQIKLISTNEDGAFDFNTPQLYTVSGKKLFLFLNNKDASSKFSIANQLLETGKKLANVPSLDEKPPLLTLPDNSELFIKSNEKSIRLKEVTITSKTVPKGGYGPNACGDYVCTFGILNCRNHYGDSNNTQPIQGKTYKTNGTSIVYAGCNVTDESILFKTEGVHLHKEFYMNTYEDPQEPAYFSTIYWNYATILNKDKETSIDFYTSDIVGKYRIVVQGITQSQVVHSEKFFEVKKK